LEDPLLGVEDYHGASVVVWCMFLFLVVIVLLNLLIAIMGDSYEKVKENEAVHALHERAKMIVEMELQHPSWHTFCDFMHVIEAVDEESKPAIWCGITGRVEQLLKPMTAKVDDAMHEVSHETRQAIVEMAGKVDATRDDMAGRMDELAGQVEAARKELKATRDEARETRGELREVRELLQLLLDKN
jgi:hypothetical protein